VLTAISESLLWDVWQKYGVVFSCFQAVSYEILFGHARLQNSVIFNRGLAMDVLPVHLQYAAFWTTTFETQDDHKIVCPLHCISTYEYVAYGTQVFVHRRQSVWTYTTGQLHIVVIIFCACVKWKTAPFIVNLGTGQLDASAALPRGKDPRTIDLEARLASKRRQVSSLYRKSNRLLSVVQPNYTV
jgi:hypothetical protein